VAGHGLPSVVHTAALTRAWLAAPVFGEISPEDRGGEDRDRAPAGGVGVVLFALRRRRAQQHPQRDRRPVESTNALLSPDYFGVVDA
jgi:hypothetical protein